MMYDSRQKEDIHIGYIYALCACAGVDYEIINHDEDSTDGILKKKIKFPDGTYFISELRIQLKATSSLSQYQDKGDYISYKLKAKNYNDLCTQGTSPIVLGLLILPENNSDWVKWSKEELLVRGCMYWADFSHNNKSGNDSTVTVNISKKNIINDETLLEILTKIAKGDW